MQNGEWWTPCDSLYVGLIAFQTHYGMPCMGSLHFRPDVTT